MSLTIFLAVTFLSMTGLPSSAQLISFDIVRTKNVFHQMLEKEIHPRVIERYYLSIKNESVPLFRFLDNEFYGEVLLGHPGQKFNVIFDSAWANSWVPSIKCKVTDIACSIHNKYNSRKSSTYKPDGREIKIQYGDSELDGILSNDLMHIGKSNITGQTFAEMIDIPRSFSLVKADGVFGLAFSSISYLKVTPFLDNMLQQGLIKKKVFSFYFNRDKSSKKGGTLFFGGSQEKHYSGNFTYVNLIDADYWRFEIKGMQVKGNTSDICGNVSCPTIVDTSSSIISGPSSKIKFINQIIGARPFVLGKYMVNCDKIGTLPSITFTIGGTNFVLKSRDYVVKITVVGISFCLTVFEANDLPDPFRNYWTLGASFMARFYMEFDADNKRIGIANVRM